MLLTAVILFGLGLCAGSFVNALVWRIHEQTKKRKTAAKQNLSVLSGRSVCPNCRHQLAAHDLIPLFSWVILRGRCRYCGKPISIQYPLVELVMGLVFALSYLFWPAELTDGQPVLLAAWLAVSTGLMALLVYDYKWMLLPNRILYPTALAAFLGRAVYIIGYEPDKADALIAWGLSLAVASGFFWLIFIISRGAWIGYGDVRLGLITGTVLGTPGKSLLMLFLASAIGTLIVLPALATGRRKLVSKIPFGPYLIVSTYLVLLLGQPVIDWYLDFTAI